MKTLATGFCLVLLLAAGVAQAQLIVFDNSHHPADARYDEFRSRLSTWGYTVEQRVTPLTDNSDADLIVILTEDAYTSSSTPYTIQEAAWLKDFVDAGGGLLASVCPNDAYWANIIELMHRFGIAEANTYTDPAYYDLFAPHPLFAGVSALGDDVIYCTSLSVSTPSEAVASDGIHDFIAVYQPVPRGTGGAVWMSEYYMFSAGGLDDWDNLIFLDNALTWLTSGTTATAETSWSALKALYR